MNEGAGIAAEHLPLLFERFYRVDQAREYRGERHHGLGLSIVKAIAMLHGGDVFVASRNGLTTVGFPVLSGGGGSAALAGLVGKRSGGPHQRVDRGRLVRTVARGHHFQACFRPCLGQVPGAARWADDVVAALYDHAGQMADAVDIAQQLVGFKEDAVTEVVRLDARLRQRVQRVIGGYGVHIVLQGGGVVLPAQPRLCRFDAGGFIGAVRRVQ
ncbi:hypothetical protein G6F61_013405 [Rhizopus arrhizus]|nr:hypothetical protein G6F61_013405 [Rhizopus arrhizus]